MIIKKLPSIKLPREIVVHFGSFLSEFKDAKIFIGSHNHEGRHSIDGKILFNLMNISLEGRVLSDVVCHATSLERENIICDAVIDWINKRTENA